MGVFDKVTKVGVDIAIAFLVIGLLWTSIIGNTFTSNVDNAINVAQTSNYTLTVTALQTWKTSDSFVLGLLFISIALNLILEMFYKKRAKGTSESVVGDVITLLVFFMIFGILVFNLAIPKVIEAGVISDSLLSTILYVLYAGLVLSAVTLLIRAYNIYKKRGESRTATISILGK